MVLLEIQNVTICLVFVNLVTYMFGNVNSIYTKYLFSYLFIYLFIFLFIYCSKSVLIHYMALCISIIIEQPMYAYGFI